MKDESHEVKPAEMCPDCGCAMTVHDRERKYKHFKSDGSGCECIAPARPETLAEMIAAVRHVVDGSRECGAVNITRCPGCGVIMEAGEVAHGCAALGVRSISGSIFQRYGTPPAPEELITGIRGKVGDTLSDIVHTRRVTLRCGDDELGEVKVTLSAAARAALDRFATEALDDLQERIASALVDRFAPRALTDLRADLEAMAASQRYKYGPPDPFLDGLKWPFEELPRDGGIGTYARLRGPVRNEAAVHYVGGPELRHLDPFEAAVPPELLSAPSSLFGVGTVPSAPLSPAEQLDAARDQACEDFAEELLGPGGELESFRHVVITDDGGGEDQ